MNAEIKEIAPCRREVAVQVPAAKVDEAFDACYKQLQERVQLRGFRRGYAPLDLIRRRFQKDAAKDVAGKLFEESFVETLKANSLAPMGEPKLGDEEIEAKPGEPFSYKVELDVRPKFEVPNYKGLQLEDKAQPASEADIDAQLVDLRKRFADYEPTAEGAAAGDMLETAVKVTVGSEELVNQDKQRLQVEGRHVYGLEVGDLAELLAGLTAGAEKVLEHPIPQDFYREDLRGQTARIEFKVGQVLRAKLPEADDAFAQRLGLADLAALRKNVATGIESRRREESQRELETQIADQLIAAVSFDLPAEFMERQKENAWERSRMRLARLGMSDDWFDKNREEMKKNSDEGVVREMRRMIIFDAIAEVEKLEITEAEIQQQLTVLARQYQTTPAKMARRIQKLDGLSNMVAELKDIKVTKLILDAANVKKTEAGK